jgi:hypothetical protein
MICGDLIRPLQNNELGMMIVLEDVKVENIEKENLHSLINNGFYDDDLTPLTDIDELGNHKLVYSLNTQHKIVIPEDWLHKNYEVISTATIPAQS